MRQPPGEPVAYPGGAVALDPGAALPRGALEVLLVRHGETRSYTSDAGLTARGRQQAEQKATEMAATLCDRRTVRFFHAPTARARETAKVIYGALSRALPPQAAGLTLVAPTASDGFRNLHVVTNGAAMDPTQLFPAYLAAIERMDRDPATMPGWVVDMERFWGRPKRAIDPIRTWLTSPLPSFEPPGTVVLRFWAAIDRLRTTRRIARRDMVVVATHSGPMRAVMAAAFGSDPGEPENLEHVGITVEQDSSTALVAFRGTAIEVAMA